MLHKVTPDGSPTHSFQPSNTQLCRRDPNVCNSGGGQFGDDDFWESDAEMKVELGGKGGDPPASRMLGNPFVRVQQGHSNLNRLIEDEIAQAQLLILCVWYGFSLRLVCGTHTLASAVKVALQPLRFVDALKGGLTVPLRVEAFGNVPDTRGFSIIVRSFL
ncbi:hypothetical protein Hypma_005726 [Hypsizygus marmoreus]|uniref:Uncharacterized protein n=1 Tax=Hypsizygus marmoreus TaxID=39966 RepID=A0A369KI51_HYPMA|nr:hypothetical protein Hypma_005726 [Hypsizygus marmoreus]